MDFTQNSLRDSIVTLEDIKRLEARVQELDEEWSRPWVGRQRNKRILEQAGIPRIVLLKKCPLPTSFGDWTMIAFGDRATGLEHLALFYGQHDESIRHQNLLCRVHSSCVTNEVFLALNCECRPEFHSTMEMMQREEGGVILYLNQEGRGTGMVGKMLQLGEMFEWQEGRIEQSRNTDGSRVDTVQGYLNSGYPPEVRDFSIAALMLEILGVPSVRLLTNNPLKAASLMNAGVSVKQENLLIHPENEIIASDLRSKAKDLGHSIPEEYHSVQTGGGM